MLQVLKRLLFALLVFLSPVVFGDSPDALWDRFLGHPDSKEKAELLVELSTSGRGNRNIINNVNNYLMEMNSLFSSGKNVDYMMVSAGISAIMELNDSSSYPVLFTAICAGYPEVITSEAYGALDYINGNLHQFLSGIIANNPPMEKFTALRAATSSRRLNVSERGQLAELALEQALAAGAGSYAASDGSADLTAMRYAAVSTLASLRWTRASALALNHYHLIREEYLRGNVPKNRFIEAIAFLGAVGNSDAALVLGLQLGLINARTERTGVFDSEITLAIVQALGQLGSNAVYDQLLYVSSMPYPGYIRSAARDAIDSLKW